MDDHYINEVLNGNTKAFGYFIKTYQDKAFGIAVSIVKQEADAQDVVQESFIKAYASLPKFKKEAKFSTWFYRIVVNSALLFIKRNKRRTAFVLENAITDPEKVAFNEAIQQLQKQDFKKLIRRVFDQLPAKEALVLQLFYIDDQGITEIEAITGFTKANIKVLLHRGRLNFYKIIKDEKDIKIYQNGR